MRSLNWAAFPAISVGTATLLGLCDSGQAVEGDPEVRRNWGFPD